MSVAFSFPLHIAATDGEASLSDPLMVSDKDSPKRDTKWSLKLLLRFFSAGSRRFHNQAYQRDPILGHLSMASSSKGKLSLKLINFLSVMILNLILLSSTCRTTTV